MTLSEELEKLVPDKKQELKKQTNQLDMADEIERTLQELGVSVQQKFEIPLSKKLVVGKS